MKITKKQGKIIAYSILGLAVIWIAWMSWVKFGPKPLDDEAIYIGRRTAGCLIPLCGSNPSDEFYYATDLTIDEVKNSYFNNAIVVSDPKYNSQSISNNWAMTFENIESKEQFNLTYFTKGKAMADYLGLDLHGKTGLLLVSDRSDYNIAKDSL